MKTSVKTSLFCCLSWKTSCFCRLFDVGQPSLERHDYVIVSNGHGGMIIQLWAAIFKRIRNVQIPALQSLFISLLSVAFSFMRSSSLIQTLPTSRCLQWRNARFCNVFLDVVSCYWNRCVKCTELFRRWIFFIHWCINNFLTNRSAGKRMNIKKIQLFRSVTSDIIFS